jgi:hypothetical protein
MLQEKTYGPPQQGQGTPAAANHPANPCSHQANYGLPSSLADRPFPQAVPYVLVPFDEVEKRDLGLSAFADVGPNRFQISKDWVLHLMAKPSPHIVTAESPSLPQSTGFRHCPSVQPSPRLSGIQHLPTRAGC